MTRAPFVLKKAIYICFINIIMVPFTYADEAHPVCQNMVDNFNAELKQAFHSARVVKGWGPRRRVLKLNPELRHCFKKAGVDWQRQRILAAADYWIKQKINYCHHYVPDYQTPLGLRNAAHNKGGYCNPAKNEHPGSVYYQQQVRWNYNGNADETPSNWSNNAMWYGVDCSNYTTFLYDFSFGVLFSSGIKSQAGQRAGKAQKNLSPNQQSTDNVLDNPHAAGKLVCKDNSLEQEHSCAAHGGYLSVIDSSGKKHHGSILSKDLAALPLYPGDLLYISTPKPHAGSVIHVVMWTGKQVGYGPNDILPNQIAPNTRCPQKEWMPHLGDWVITDSHYQGPDYRVMSACYYLNNLWGVRRVIY